MANELLQNLQRQLDDDNLMEALSQQIGGADKEQTKAAANGIMTSLMGAMAKQPENVKNNNAITNFLDQDGDGSMLDDLMGMMTRGGGQQSGGSGLMGGLMDMMSGQRSETPKSNIMEGVGIVNSLLGGKQNGIVNMISQISGLDSSKTGSLLTVLGPMFLSTLTKTKKQAGVDNDGLMNLVTDSFNKRKTLDVEAEEAGPGEGATGLISKFLDQDGDGDVTDDLTNMGVKFIGSLFK